MKQISYIILLSLVIFFNYSCKENVIEENSSLEKETSSDIIIDQKQFDNSNFEIGKIESISLDKKLQITGKIHLPEKSKALVSTIISGTIGRMNLIEGQKVSKGQKLFSLTNPDLINIQEEYLIAKNTLEYLKDAFARQQELSLENITTKKELLKAKTELTTTESKMSALEKKLKLYGINSDNLTNETLVSAINIYAPISGYISNLSAIQGMYLESNVPALKIENNDNMFLELSILEKDVHQLQKGQKVTFSTQSNSEQTFNATINLINKYIDANHMVKVNCTLEHASNPSLFPGMFVNAQLILESYKANALPESTLIKSNGKWMALRLKEKNDKNFIFEKVSMKAGQIQDGYIEIEGLKSDSQSFLTKGAYYLIQ